MKRSLQYKLFSGLMAVLPLRLRVIVLYFRRFKKLPNLEEPQTFNEKVNWTKLHVRDDILTVAADKLRSKDLVKKICPEVNVPATIWEGTDFLGLDMSRLPPKYVIKANHGSQMILFHYDCPHSIRGLERIRKHWFKTDHFSALGEWAYAGVEKKVFVEEYLDASGASPADYKFFVFGGVVEFCQVDSSRFTGHERNMFDRDWNDLEIDYSHPRSVPPPVAPKTLPKMIEIAECLGADFSFVRVDLYEYQDVVYFGELTIYPGAGYEKFPSYFIDKMFGEPWNITR